MDPRPRKFSFEAFQRGLSAITRKANGFLQTPFGATAGGGLVVVVVAKLLFG